MALGEGKNVERFRGFAGLPFCEFAQAQQVPFHPFAIRAAGGQAGFDLGIPQKLARGGIDRDRCREIARQRFPLERMVEGLREIDGGLRLMAANYEGAEAASQVVGGPR